MDENVTHTMSTLTLPQLLIHEKLTKMKAHLLSFQIVGVVYSASTASKCMKNSLHIYKNITQTLPQLQSNILLTLKGILIFQITSLPKNIYILLFFKTLRRYS